MQSMTVGVWGFKRSSEDTPPEIFERLRNIHPNVVIQLMNAKFVAGLDHVSKIAFQVSMDMRKENLLANREELHLLMKMTCQDQIEQAIKVGGLGRESSDLVAIGLGKKRDIEKVSRTLNELFGSDADRIVLLTPSRKKFLMSFHRIPVELVNRLEKRGMDITDILAEKAALLCLGD
ncbi:MAG: KEOPS complex subunit Cgi121 [Nitrososphaerales archaeon]